MTKEEIKEQFRANEMEFDAVFDRLDEITEKLLSMDSKGLDGTESDKTESTVKLLKKLIDLQETQKFLDDIKSRL